MNYEAELWAEQTGIVIAQEYMGTDGHHRTVQTVERHFGNMQVRVFDGFLSKVQWLEINEWRELNGDFRP